MVQKTAVSLLSQSGNGMSGLGLRRAPLVLPSPSVPAVFRALPRPPERGQGEGGKLGRR